eukprot:COSAG02_NODE_326_length_24603_cov_123.455681_17_plen_194_part_00
MPQLAYVIFFEHCNCSLHWKISFEIENCPRTDQITLYLPATWARTRALAHAGGGSERERIAAKGTQRPRPKREAEGHAALDQGSYCSLEQVVSSVLPIEQHHERTARVPTKQPISSPLADAWRGGHVHAFQATRERYLPACHLLSVGAALRCRPECHRCRGLGDGTPTATLHEKMMLLRVATACPSSTQSSSR